MNTAVIYISDSLLFEMIDTTMFNLSKLMSLLSLGQLGFEFVDLRHNIASGWFELFISSERIPDGTSIINLIFRNMYNDQELVSRLHTINYYDDNLDLIKMDIIE